MTATPTNFTAAAWQDPRDEFRYRSISLTQSRLFVGRDRSGSEVEREDTRPAFEVRIDGRDKPARTELKAMGGRWSRLDSAWIVPAAEAVTLARWADRWMAGGAYSTDAGALNGGHRYWRGIIGDGESVRAWTIREEASA